MFLILDAAFVAYSWELPAYSGACLLTVVFRSFLLTAGAFLLTASALLLTVAAFCLQWEIASNKHRNGM